LAEGRASEAQQAFVRALALTPRRALSLLGLARAATAAGDSSAAAEAYADLRRVWHQADADLPSLAEVRQSQAR
jgi:cytochrome c-type biogenesis protein CcmH/NrfG